MLFNQTDFRGSKPLVSLLRSAAFLFLLIRATSADVGVLPPAELARQLLNGFVTLSPREAGAVEYFAQTLVLPRINLEQMAIGLCGRSQWQAWNKDEKRALIDALHGTLVRYVMEAGAAYQQQQLFVEKEDVINQVERVVRVLVKSDYLPNVSVDLYVRQDSAGQWLAHDFAVAGISYVKMKRAQYKTLLAMGGLPTLLQHLNRKNDEFSSDNKLGNKLHLSQNDGAKQRSVQVY